MAEVTFRPLKQSDYSELRKMIHALHREDPADKMIDDRKISRTIREMRKKRAVGKIIIFEGDCGIIGYSILVYFWSNEYGGRILNVDELYVKPEARRLGVATRFFDHLSWAFKNKIVAVKLEVTPSNTKALTYYRKLGFKKTRNQHLIQEENRLGIKP